MSSHGWSLKIAPMTRSSASANWPLVVTPISSSANVKAYADVSSL